MKFGKTTIALEPLMAGSTLEVRSDTGMKPLPAALGEAGRPRKTLLAGIFDVHCFHAFTRLVIDPELYWQGGLL
ncbi:hypothetical protein G2W53_035807 [Senna tora]|uniref:Uncharacterized protein n=1 Tax=Senna tora TaxID=362788 RepID=A0A834SSE8_9FABA|nr:hypothetical protein G2W53_035807 [Senna tora]